MKMSVPSTKVCVFAEGGEANKYAHHHITGANAGGPGQSASGASWAAGIVQFCPDGIMRRANRDAFTLMELLLVFAIIGILVALLMTEVAQAKAGAKQIQCANNVRQLGLASQEFRTDHGSYPVFLDPSEHSQDRYWKNALGYEMNIHHNVDYYPKGVWHCPAAHRPSNPAWTLHKERGYDDYGYNAYGLGSVASTNSSLGLSEHWFPYSPNASSMPISRVKESEVVSPSEMIGIGDGFFGGPGAVQDGVVILGRASDSVVSSAGFPGYDYSESTKRAYARHSGHENIAFCDGHVESPTLKFLFQDTSDVALSVWNRDHNPHRERLQ